MIQRIWNMYSKTKASLPKETFSRGGHGICSVTPHFESFRCTCLQMPGNGIINADGELWKVQRKAGLQFLNNANLKVLTDVALPAYLNEIVKSLQEDGQGSVVDLEEVLHELTTQLMGRMAYDVGEARITMNANR